jgi:hypothetical protein
MRWPSTLIGIGLSNGHLPCIDGLQDWSRLWCQRRDDGLRLVWDFGVHVLCDGGG